jgi:AcrR family transcriptional regulator
MQETMRLVAERGLGGTSVIDIEAAAGLSPGSGAFYRHFHTKEEALAAAVDDELARLHERPDLTASGWVPSSGAGSAPTTAEVAKQLRAGVDWLDEMGPLIAVVMREGREFTDATRGLRECIANGGMSPGLAIVTRAAKDAGRDPWATAVLVTMASVGFHLAASFFGSPVEGVDADRFAAVLADMVTSPSPGGAAGA